MESLISIDWSIWIQNMMFRDYNLSIVAMPYKLNEERHNKIKAS